MKIYHGSTITIEKPQVLPLSRRLDFGAGFYTTSDLEQARRWARIKKRRKMAGAAIVSTYDASVAFDENRLAVKHFEEANEEWLSFVMEHRMGNAGSSSGYDIIRGPVANDTLYETLSLYERGILTHSETIVRLRTHKLADQIVFSTESALSLLAYVGSEEVTDG